jgi:hypothetical protein
MVAKLQLKNTKESGGILRSNFFTDQERLAYAAKRKDHHQIAIEDLGFYSPKNVREIYLDIKSRKTTKNRVA